MPVRSSHFIIPATIIGWVQVVCAGFIRVTQHTIPHYCSLNSAAASVLERSSKKCIFKYILVFYYLLIECVHVCLSPRDRKHIMEHSRSRTHTQITTLVSCMPKQQATAAIYVRAKASQMLNFTKSYGYM